MTVRGRGAEAATSGVAAVSALGPELRLAVEQRIERAAAERVVRRVLDRDASLWGPEGTPELADRLGWLDSPREMRGALARLADFREKCLADGLTDAVVLGMGGSSLAPEVLRRSFDGAVGAALSVHVLDSTDAGAVLALERRLDLRRTLFLVSTKSGGTIETLSLYAHFAARVAALERERPGRHFAAITDPGSSLEGLARKRDFRHTFLNDPEIGGRYSALSYFGLVPAALQGVDLDALLAGAERAVEACRAGAGGANDGLWLGAALGELALRGRDKLTLVLPEPIASFGLWVEQLVAESTGKEGRGILPVADEPLAAPERYGADRVFAVSDEARSAQAQALAAAGHPVIRIPLAEPAELGALFYLWEFATAVAGWTLGINPFDQPNVQEAKDRTSAVLDRHAHAGELPSVASAADDALRALVGGLAPPRYLAIMGYLAPSREFEAAVDALRARIRDESGVATTFGYGPRFLHSTGQLHKGGPPNGAFLQLVHDGPEDVAVPGAGHSFATLKNAQAIGDLEALRAHGLPAEQVRLEGDPTAALERLAERIEVMLR